MSVCIDFYLRQSIAVLSAHSLEPSPSDEAWSAAYSALSILLGNRFTKELRRTGKLKHDYRYNGNTFLWLEGEMGTDDHVIPLTCVIEALIANPVLWSSPAQLEAFLVEHIVIAQVPLLLDKKLVLCTMPNPDWACQVGAGGFSAGQKLAAVWSRYAKVPGIAVPNMYGGNSDFFKRLANLTSRPRTVKVAKSRACPQIIWSSATPVQPFP